MWTIQQHANADDLLAQAMPLLLRAEAVNNVVIGVAGAIQRGEFDAERALLVTVHADHQVVGAMVQTPPHAALLSRMPKAAAGALGRWCRTLGRASARAGHTLAGVTAEVECAAAFARNYVPDPAVIQVAARTRYHELRQVAQVPTAAGRAEVAGPEVAPMLLAWAKAFHMEADPHGPPPQRDLIERRLSDGRFWLFRDPAGEAVCMALRNRELPHGASVGPVYTPPAQRGRGYATSLVAELSRHILADGKDFACLVTDLSNPTSNRIYAAIGYQPVADFDALRF